MPKDKMVSIREILALNLKEYRRKCGFTQEKLAEKAGISANYLSMVEITRKFPTPEMLDRLAQTLNIQTFQLFDPKATTDGALLHLEQAIVENIETVVRKAIKQVLSEEIKNDIKNTFGDRLEQVINDVIKQCKV
jgi:transcriptional regulator with XRE-family HTH domain